MREGGQEATMGEARRAAREREREQQEREDRSYAGMEAFLDRNPSAGGAIVPDEDSAATKAAPSPAQGLDPDADAVGNPFYYREWDVGIEDYKPRWVLLREHQIKEGSRAFVDDVMRRQRVNIDALRRRFEALRPDALVRVRNLTEDHVNAKTGGPRSDRLYQRDQRDRRDVAVAFLLDMSSSTNESADGSPRRIIEVEKEALIVAAEALSALGDPFAIYGFSGYGRDHVAFYIAKDFADPYGDRIRERIGRMNFKMENRDGTAIRHAASKLAREPARTRLLILLSDGKPLDCGCDHYYDRYAQEDTRAALREARQMGVHPFCITVDPAGGDYLARMYGEVAYTVIDRVDHLPDRLVALYRKLTT